MAHSTSFESVVAQALIAHPDDAHIFVERYLQRKNLQPDKTEIFRRAWAKVSLESRAFGAKGVTPEVFASELLVELTKTWHPTLFQMQRYADDLRQRSTRENCDDVSIYEESLAFHNEIVHHLRSVLNSQLRARVYPSIGDVIDSVTESASKSRVKWTSEVDAETQYCPLSTSHYLVSRIRRGITHDAATSQAHHVTGLVVSFKCDLTISDVYEVIDVLYDYVHPAESLFPQPHSISTDDTTGDTTFSFYDNHHTSLATLINNSTFHRQLRQHFFVLAAWFRQVAYTCHRLSSTEKALIQTPQLQDDGLLTIGNLIVATREPTKDQLDGAVEKMQTFLHDLLSTCLGTSRCVSLPLCSPRRNPMIDMSAAEELMHLAEGSTLHIRFTDRGSRQLAVFSPDLDPDVLALYPILFRCDDVGVQLSVDQDKVAIRGLHPGTATVTVSRSVDGPALYIFKIEVFNISDSVIPEVNEACGLLNDAYVYSVPLFLGASYCYSNDSTLTASNLIARDWLDLALKCRVIDTIPDDDLQIGAGAAAAAGGDKEAPTKKIKKRSNTTSAARMQPSGPTAQELALAALEEDMQEMNRDAAIQDMTKNRKGVKSKISSTAWK